MNNDLKTDRLNKLDLPRETLVLISLLLFFTYSLSRNLMSNIGIGNNIIGYYLLFLSYLTLTLAILRGRTKSFKKAMGILIGVALLLLFSQLLHPENGGVLIKGIAPQYGIVIILFVCSLEDTKRINDSLVIYGIITLLSCLVGLIPYLKNGGYWIMSYAGRTIYTSYNMTVGYNASFAALIFWTAQKKSGKKSLLIIPIICFLLSVALGSRGSLMCYIIFASLTWLSAPKSNKKSLTLVLLIGLATIILFIGKESIITLLSNILDHFGVSSRTLKMLSDDYTGAEISSGRNEMWNIIIKKIWEKPILGYGAFGDRTMLNLCYSDNDSLYSHNIVLEMWVSFGVIIGSLFIILLFEAVINTWRKLKGTPLMELFICLLSYNIANLLVSNTFWYSTAFWYLIGVIIIVSNCDELRYSHEAKV